MYAMIIPFELSSQLDFMTYCSDSLWRVYNFNSAIKNLSRISQGIFNTVLIFMPILLFLCVLLKKVQILTNLEIISLGLRTRLGAESVNPLFQVKWND